MLCIKPTLSLYDTVGIDVSRYQGEINWQEFASQNISFAFIKATEGSNHVDKCFADNWQNNDIKQSLHYEYMNNLYRRTGYHNYSTPEGEHFRAEIEDIGPQGHLTLRLESGELRTFAFKEVIFELK